MSNGAGGSKKNQESDANQVTASTKAHQRRMTQIQQEEHNDGRKYNGKIQLRNVRLYTVTNLKKQRPLSDAAFLGFDAIWR